MPDKEHDIPMRIKMGTKSFQGISRLASGAAIDESVIIPLCDFIDARLDCADFRLITLLRVLHSSANHLSVNTLSRMKKTVLNFRYWMDEPGHDSICWWSENHQILFFSCQFLAGGLYPDEVFTCGGLTGAALRSKARVRILRWMRRRWDHGFVEWHSNTYYEEDAAPLVNLVDFADDKEIAGKAAIILDLLLADMAMHSFRGLFSVSSGRCYEDQKKHPLMQDTLEIEDWAFGFENRRRTGDRRESSPNAAPLPYDDERLGINLVLSENYRVPEVIRSIARDDQPAEILCSMGMDLSEVRRELGPLGDIENAGYYLWSMEAFTNPESVKPTMKMYRRFGMASNDFLKDLKVLDVPVLRPLLPTVTRILNPATNGVAIQRSDTCTWRTGSFMLSTAMNHHPGSFGDQQHIWQATLSDEVTVFTTHPGAAMFEDNARNFSPGYWVGNGIQPHAVQHRNVVMAIYDTRFRKGFLEAPRAEYTHAWFPFDLFDETELESKRALGRLGRTVVALTGGGELELKTDGPDAGREIRQHGKVTWWICEILENIGSLDEAKRILETRTTDFRKGRLHYRNRPEGDLSLQYRGDFRINDVIQNTRYPRLESPWGGFHRKSDEITLQNNEMELYLNFDKGIREERQK